MRKNLWITGAVVALVLILDQVIKVWVKQSFTVYDDPVNLIGDGLRLVYTENPGMAFGTTFGGGMWAKLALSIFRIVAVGGITYYLVQQAKKQAKLMFLISLGFVLAGALGNLLDSMFYDFLFAYDPCISFNHMEGSGIYSDCGIFGKIETRHTGFLLGNVVDMFQFNFTWPSWVPVVGGGEIFPAIWNLADGSISVGVLMMLLGQRSFFSNKQADQSADQDSTAD